MGETHQVMRASASSGKSKPLHNIHFIVTVVGVGDRHGKETPKGKETKSKNGKRKKKRERKGESKRERKGKGKGKEKSIGVEQA